MIGSSEEYHPVPVNYPYLEPGIDSSSPPKKCCTLFRVQRVPPEVSPGHVGAVEHKKDQEDASLLATYFKLSLLSLIKPD